MWIEIDIIYMSAPLQYKGYKKRVGLLLSAALFIHNVIQLFTGKPSLISEIVLLEISVICALRVVAKAGNKLLIVAGNLFGFSEALYAV